MPVSPKDLLDSPDVLKLFSEGNIISAKSFISSPTQTPTFKRMVVLEVIPDPVSVLDPGGTKLDYWKNVLGVSNIKYAGVLPRNTIVAQFAYDDISPMFVFPFFPSHLAFPCKPGEMVWVVIEDPGFTRIDMAYWMCRITEPHVADDVNHTHSPRGYDISFAGIDRTSKQERSKEDGRTNPWYELRNGNVTVRPDGVRQTDVNTMLLTNADNEDYFERLVRNTDGALLSQYEAVPRFKKRPGDVALEGSNNTLIVLGTDRAGPAAEFFINTQNPIGPRPQIPSTDFSGDAGSIDLVAGRGQTPETLGVEVETTSIFGSTATKKGPAFKTELGKAEDQLSQAEGDFDLTNDRSRLRISQRTNVDANFGLSDYNSSNYGIEDSAEGDASIVIKTDKIRLISRSDIEILVTNYLDAQNARGLSSKTEDGNTDMWAAIIIRKNGDIVMRPAKEGYIKLGSDNADKALLCTDTPAVANGGQVSAPPITDTSVGFIGTGAAGQGTWAKKILVD